MDYGYLHLDWRELANRLSREHRIDELFALGDVLGDAMTLLHGVELNIGPRGELDYDPELRAGFDFCLASVHDHFELDRAAQLRHVVAQHLAEAARLQEVPLHVDDQQRDTRRIKGEPIRFCLYFDHDTACFIGNHPTVMALTNAPKTLPATIVSYIETSAAGRKAWGSAPNPAGEAPPWAQYLRDGVTRGDGPLAGSGAEPSLLAYGVSSIRLTCAATMRQPSVSRAQLCI